jgi:hypothetical protein
MPLPSLLTRVVLPDVNAPASLSMLKPPRVEPGTPPSSCTVTGTELPAANERVVWMSKSTAPRELGKGS